jgi:hypothetical protein
VFISPSACRAVIEAKSPVSPKSKKPNREGWALFFVAHPHHGIRAKHLHLKSTGIGHLEDDDGVEEGGIIYAVHKHYERDNSAIRRKKKDVFDKHMALKCEVGDFDFAEVYGELGDQFAECHHTKPVAKMKAGEKTKQSDLSIVCANCHRMLHRGRDLLSIEGLKAVLVKERALAATKSTFKYGRAHT